jgi:phosphopantothenoylcysteine decarboxylase/phosphopantothenate--cysteine ligase
MLSGKRVLLGVTGGIAAYKAVEILRRLQERGADVRVVMTANAKAFVGPLTFQAISGHPVASDMFDTAAEARISHIELATTADLVLIAPATAGFIGKLAAGLADDLLSTLCLAAQCPLVVAPSMNDRMYVSGAVQANLGLLRRRGVVVIEPESGRLACGTSGAGRLPAPEAVAAEVAAILARSGDMAGLRVVITAGPTREAIDPVRYLSNRSSGRMGVALARRAARRGASVTLVYGPGSAVPPQGIDLVRVESAAEMAAKALEAAAGADVFIAAAAVADYAPAEPATRKIKKSSAGLTLALRPTVDILATVGRMKKRPFLVGFAAETGEPSAEARRKLAAKKADLVVANDVSRSDSGFDVDDIQVLLVSARETIPLPLLPKEDAADRILDRVLFLRRAGAAG